MRRSDRVLLVGSYQPRYLDPLRQWAERLRNADCVVAERYHDVHEVDGALTALADPRDLVVYFGHGRPGAVRAFGGIDAADLLALEADTPHRVVAVLCCDGFTAPENGISVGSALLNEGLATTVIGYSHPVEHETNRATLDRLLEAYRSRSDAEAVAIAERIASRCPLLDLRHSQVVNRS